MESFLQHNSYIVTLLVGLFAFVVYSQQKWDKKRNVASAMFVEIKNAEEGLGKIKTTVNNGDQSIIPDDIFLMPVESWSRNRQDFIKDFRSDEWSALDNFYAKCKLYDENAKNNAQAFTKNEEQIRINAHRLVANYMDEFIDSLKDIESESELGNKDRERVKAAYALLSKNVDLVNGQYLTSAVSKPVYSPQKYLDLARTYSSEINNLSLGSVGEKLSRISRRSWIRQILHLYSSN